MNTQCKDFQFSCPLPGSQEKRRIDVDFFGGTLTSDGGVVLLGLADDRLALISRLAGCFQDSRNPLFTVHSVEALGGRPDARARRRLRAPPIRSALPRSD